MSSKWGINARTAPAAVRASLEPIIRFFSYHDAHPVALSMVLMEKFGFNWFAWEPETLKKEILHVFRAPSISEHNWNKIQAVRTLGMSTAFWEEWHVFEKVIQALNNCIPRFDVGQKCTMSKLMAGVDMANSIQKEKFSDEVERYVAACAIDEGVTYLPDPLDFAQTVLSAPKFHCRDCGTVDYDDLDDNRCDFCVGRFTGEHPLDRKPSRFVAPDVGRNIEKFLTRDPEPAKDRFEELRNDLGLELDETIPEDVQAAKLVVAYKYQVLRRKQLVEQLEELKSWITH